jgi:hypothetical protein
MLYTGRLLGQDYGELKMLTPLSFKCDVKGMELIATITAKVNNPTDFVYRIRFSDGYQSDFTATHEGRWYDMANEKQYREASKRPYSPYADAIQNDLRDLHLFEIYEEAYSFRMQVGGTMTNVYVLKDSEEDGGFYNVRFNGQYQFSLTKAKGVWHAGSKYDKVATSNINNELARNISLMIESQQ